MQTLCENAFQSNAHLTFCLLSSVNPAMSEHGRSFLPLPGFTLKAFISASLLLQCCNAPSTSFFFLILSFFLSFILAQVGMLLQFWLSLPTTHTYSKLISSRSLASAFLGSLSPQISLQDHPLAWHLKNHGDYTWLVTFDVCSPPGKASLFFDLSTGTWALQSLLNRKPSNRFTPFPPVFKLFILLFLHREKGERRGEAYSLVRSRDLELSWSPAWKEQNDLQWVFSSFLLWQIIL